MRSTEIENIKAFTSRLFAGCDFDDFLVAEAAFSTAATFSIDGHINSGFAPEDGAEPGGASDGIISWKAVKHICFEIIKGKRVPLGFKIIFKAPAHMAGQFISSQDIFIDKDQINGLFLNINFRPGRLSCVTGISLKTFTMDKTLENQWDEYMSGFLARLQ